MLSSLRDEEKYNSSASKCCRDRTREFFAEAHRLQQQSTSRPLVQKHRQHQQQDALQNGDSVRFTKAAAQISQGLQETTHKLENLAKLTKSTSIFNDPSENIQHQTHVIKEDLKTLNNEIDTLARFMESHRRSFGGAQSSSHSETIVATLQTELGHTTQQFAEILQTRTKKLKAQNNRRKQFSSSKPRHQPQRKVHVNVELDLEADEHTGLLEDDSSDQKQMTVAREDTYLQSRLEAVESIEQTIVELGQMYQRLSTLVAMQNDYCVRIDANIEDTQMNMEEGHKQLLKYFDNISSNRWLILKVFFVMIVFAVFFVVFVA